MTPLGVTSESQKYLILASGAVRAEGCVGNAPVCLDASPSASRLFQQDGSQRGPADSSLLPFPAFIRGALGQSIEKLAVLELN
jgi:hypothetical protein